MVWVVFTTVDLPFSSSVVLTMRRMIQVITYKALNDVVQVHRVTLAEGAYPYGDDEGHYYMMTVLPRIKDGNRVGRTKGYVWMPMKEALAWGRIYQTDYDENHQKYRYALLFNDNLFSELQTTSWLHLGYANIKKTDFVDPVLGIPAERNPNITVIHDGKKARR